MNHKSQGYSILHRLALLIICIGWFWLLYAIWGPLRDEFLLQIPPFTALWQSWGYLFPTSQASIDITHIWRWDDGSD